MTNDDLVDSLARLGTAEFVLVMQRVFRERSHDHTGRHFRSRYALAVCVESKSDDDDFREVDFVAYPTAPSVEVDLSEAGICGSCGQPALSTAKVAECAVCGESVGLT